MLLGIKTLTKDTWSLACEIINLIYFDHIYWKFTKICMRKCSLIIAVEEMFGTHAYYRITIKFIVIFFVCICTHKKLHLIWLGSTALFAIVQDFIGDVRLFPNCPAFCTMNPECPESHAHTLKNAFIEVNRVSFRLFLSSFHTHLI